MLSSMATAMTLGSANKIYKTNGRVTSQRVLWYQKFERFLKVMLQ